MLQLHSGVTLVGPSHKASAYKSAMVFGGYYDDLEIQTTLEILNGIPQYVEPHYIYDIGAKSGIYSQSYKHATDRIVVACEGEEYSSHLTAAGITTETMLQLDNTNRMVDLIRIDNEPEALQLLKNVICTCMPIVLITVHSKKLDLVLPHMLEFGYSYYILIDHPDPFKRQFVHQLERSIDKVRKALESQYYSQTLLFYVPGGHKRIRHTTMLPWTMFWSEFKDLCTDNADRQSLSSDQCQSSSKADS